MFSAMATRNLKALAIVKQIFRELRNADAGWKKSDEAELIRNYAKEHKLTQRLLGKGPNEVEHLASCYATYLSSSRKLVELQSKYGGNEKSVEESANLVGLSLPERKM